jgi:hypothetical protein
MCRLLDADHRRPTSAEVTYHLEIMPLSLHRWVVRYEDDTAPLSEHPTQAGARADARNWARQFDETVVHVHELDGGCHSEGPLGTGGGIVRAPCGQATGSADMDPLT